MEQIGITFRNQALPYTKDHYMRNHYDHGTGITVADVDGDGLYDIYFVNQVGGNELWKNLGNGKFKNITDDAGVGLKDRINVSAAFGDVNNSEWAAPIITGWGVSVRVSAKGSIKKSWSLFRRPAGLP